MCLTILRTCWERSLDTKTFMKSRGGSVTAIKKMTVLYIKDVLFYTIFKILL